MAQVKFDFLFDKGIIMRSKFIKLTVAATLLTSSAVALAANTGCCGDIVCCIKMLACCL